MISHFLFVLLRKSKNQKVVKKALFTCSWRLHRITHGPDVSIQVLRIPLESGQSRLVIVGAGYWDNKLYAVWTDG